MAKSRLPTDLLARTEPTATKRTKASQPAKKKRTTTTGTRKATRRRKEGDAEAGRMGRMTLILREDQLRWLRREAFEAKDRGELDIDMSSVVRGLIDNVMDR